MVDCFLIGKFSLDNGEKRKTQHSKGMELLYKGLREFYAEPEPEKFLIEKTETGKPFFSDKPEYNFNISHSGEHCAVMISDKICGADVEEIRNFPKRVLKRICTDEELEYLSSLPEEEQKAARWMLWTLKESYVKAVGKGLSFGMKNISFEALPEITASICKAEKSFYLKREDMEHIEHNLGDFYIFFDGDICVSFCLANFSMDC